MDDIYNEAADAAGVPEEFRAEVIGRARRTMHAEMVRALKDLMHEHVMNERAARRQEMASGATAGS